MFVDGLDIGRDRRIYVLIMEKMKSGPRYTTYDSHPKSEWILAAEEVVSRVNMKGKRRMSQSLNFNIGQKLAPNRYVGSLRLWRFTESK